MNAIEITGLKKSFGDIKAGLKKSFGDIKAVDDISFFVKRGSLFAFLGLNGAGKSTTINIICTLLKKDAGKVRVAGIDLDSDPFGDTPRSARHPRLRRKTKFSVNSLARPVILW